MLYFVTHFHQRQAPLRIHLMHLLELLLCGVPELYVLWKCFLTKINSYFTVRIHCLKRKHQWSMFTGDLVIENVVHALTRVTFSNLI